VVIVNLVALTRTSIVLSYHIECFGFAPRAGEKSHGRNGNIKILRNELLNAGIRQIPFAWLLDYRQKFVLPGRFKTLPTSFRDDMHADTHTDYSGLRIALKRHFLMNCTRQQVYAITLV
jgi:hypothetical protein